jgi:hypothetical protein
VIYPQRPNLQNYLNWFCILFEPIKTVRRLLLYDLPYYIRDEIGERFLGCDHQAATDGIVEGYIDDKDAGLFVQNTPHDFHISQQRSTYPISRSRNEHCSLWACEFSCCDADWVLEMMAELTLFIVIKSRTGRWITSLGTSPFLHLKVFI